MTWVLLCWMALLAVLLLRTRKYRHVIGYGPAFDQSYPMPESGATVIEAEVEGTTLRLPHAPAAGDTLFAAIHLRSTWSAGYIAPIVRLRAPDYEQEHHFERGAQGVRHINLSALAPYLRLGPLEVEIVTNRTTVQAGSLALHSFGEVVSDDERILVLAPHPDDAEISAFSLYTRYPDSSFILTVTAGERGNLRCDQPIEAMPENLLKGQLRTYDSLVVGLWGGVPPDRCANLGYFDGSLRGMRLEPGVPPISAAGVAHPDEFRRMNVFPLPALGDPTWHTLVADFKHVIDTFQPTTIVCPHAQFDWHGDHLFTTLAALEAIEGHQNPPKVLLYINHHPQSEAYPFGPAGQPIDLPASFGEPVVPATPLWVPQSRHAQLKKAYALNMMHDLRPAPEILLKVRPLRVVMKALKDWLLRSDEYDVSYFRRAIRSGELFFVVQPHQVATFRQQLTETLVGKDHRAA